MLNKILAVSLIAFSSLVLASEPTDKIELVCDGIYTEFEGGGNNSYPETGALVIVNFTKNIVTMDGFLGGNYLITKITNERVSFQSSEPGKLEFVGGINRYTGEVIMNDKSTDKITHHSVLNCKKAKRIF